MEVRIAVYPGAQQAAVLGLTDVFEVANRVVLRHRSDGKTLVRVTHWRPDDRGEPASEFDSCPAAGATTLAAVILPPSLGEPVTATDFPILLAWLRELHGQGVVLASVCAGAFLLAATGLMAGRRMTTHWSHAELLQTRYPDIRVDADRLLIDDGDIISAGGLMAWTDLGLRLVDRLLGPSVMIETARMLLVDPSGREQRFYSVFSPRLTHGDRAILKVQHWLQATEAQDISLASMAAEAGLEERTFLRRFQKATGMRTTEYCQRLRVGKARELLQFSAATVEQIAWDVGYSDVGAFRKVFMRILGLSPSDYRRRFTPTYQPFKAADS